LNTLLVEEREPENLEKNVLPELDSTTEIAEESETAAVEPESATVEASQVPDTSTMSTHEPQNGELSPQPF
jgi:hypothetical protein